MILANKKNISLYQSHYPEIVKEAFQGGPYSDTLYANHFMAAQSYPTQFRSLYEKRFLKIFPSIEPLNFETLGVFPHITPPPLFFISLPEPADMFFLKCIRGEKFYFLAREILNRSKFKKGDKRFRTDVSQEKLFIAGENGKTLLHLAGISHELGHALYETLHPQKINPTLSEAFALTLEEEIVGALLSGTEKKDWLFYQEQIDLLNFRMLLEEARFLKISIQNSLPHTFGKHALLLRETFFTATGYQLVYAEASLLRSNRSRRLIAATGS